MKIISPDILDAIHRMKLQLGTNTEVARKFGVSSKHIGKILSGEVKYFEDKTWKRIESIIAPYIKLSGTQKLNLSEEEVSIIGFLRKPENKADLYELLAKIERQKQDQQFYNVEEAQRTFPEAAENSGKYSPERE